MTKTSIVVGLLLLVRGCEAFGLAPSLLPTASSNSLRKTCLARSGVAGLTAQRSSSRAPMDKSKGWGWSGRPGTSITEDDTRELKSRMSVTGALEVDGASIKYDYLPGDGPVIMYLPALNRTRHGEKATYLKTWCRRSGRSFLVADYFGVGQSSGDYKDATVSRWVKDTSALIDWLAKEQDHKEVVLVGAGVGGWVMLHVAEKMAASVVGLVGIAADPDFTEDVVLPKLSEEIKKKIYAEGMSNFEWGGKQYTLTKKMIEDGKDMLLLNKGPNNILVTCPVRLIQGLGDEEIPPERALKLSDCIQGKDVIIQYVKYGSHEMDDSEADFKRIYVQIQDIDRALGRQQWQRSMAAPK